MSALYKSYSSKGMRSVAEGKKDFLTQSALNIRKALDIRKILLPLDGRNGTHGVSEAREDKAGRPVLDAEEVTVSLSTNAKG